MGRMVDVRAMHNRTKNISHARLKHAVVLSTVPIVSSQPRRDVRRVAQLYRIETSPSTYPQGSRTR